MASLPKQISDFMASYGVLSDEIWQVHGTSWVVKHKALERVAAEKGVKFAPPTFVENDAEKKIVVMWVEGKLGDRVEWSIGEAAPYNNKNSYPFAMAEKRAKDRVILKLLNTHGVLYSEEEADDFKQKRQNPHVTRPTDIVPDVEYDQYGAPIDNIPDGDPGIERLPKAKSNPEFAALQKEMYATKSIAELEAWGQRNANRIASLHSEYQAIMRGIYAEHRDELRKEKAAA